MGERVTVVCVSAVGGGVKVKWDGVGVRNVVWGGGVNLEVSYSGIQCRVQRRYCTVCSVKGIRFTILEFLLAGIQLT